MLRLWWVNGKKYLYNISKIEKDQGSDKGGGVVQRLLVGTKRNAYGAQLQNSVHGTFFAATKYRTTFSDSENNSKSALQNPMHLKLKNS